MSKYKNLPTILHTSLKCEDTLKASHGCKALNQVMDLLTADVRLGAEYTGYIHAHISESSVREIWPLYQKLHEAIGNVKYEFTGGLIDVLDIKLAKKDKSFQKILNKLTKD